MVETYFAQIAYGAVVIEIPWRGLRWETEMVKSKWKAPELNHCPYRRSTSQKVPIVTTQLSNRCSLSLTVAPLSLTVTVHTQHKTAEKTVVVIELVAILSAVGMEEQQPSP